MEGGRWKGFPIGWMLVVFDLNAKHRKLCQTFYCLNISSFFYNPLLRSFSLCVVLKEPLSFPPLVRGVVKSLWSPAQPRSLLLILLSSFNSQQRNGVHGDHGFEGFSLFKPTLSEIFFFCVYVCLCAPSQRPKTFLYNLKSVVWLQYEETSSQPLLNRWSITFSGQLIQF